MPMMMQTQADQVIRKNRLSRESTEPMHSQNSPATLPCIPSVSYVCTDQAYLKNCCSFWRAGLPSRRSRGQHYSRWLGRHVGWLGIRSTMLRQIDRFDRCMVYVVSRSPLLPGRFTFMRVLSPRASRSNHCPRLLLVLGVREQSTQSVLDTLDHGFPEGLGAHGSLIKIEH